MKTSGNEKWHKVESWPKYKVSNYGNVVFDDGNICRPKKAIRGSGGYFRVTFWDKKKKRVQTFSVHRLVARYFVKGVNESLDVAHLDGDKSNNNAKNLKWCSRSENEGHKKNHGTFIAGARSPILNLHCVKAIRNLRKQNWSQQNIADIFEVTQQTICNALKPNYADALIKALNEKGE